MQLALLNTIIAACSRIRFRADLNWLDCCWTRSSIVYTKKKLEMVLTQSISQKIFKSILWSKWVTPSLVAVATMINPWANVLRLVAIKNTPSKVFKDDKYSTEESIMLHPRVDILAGIRYFFLSAKSYFFLDFRGLFRVAARVMGRFLQKCRKNCA